MKNRRLIAAVVGVALHWQVAFADDLADLEISGSVSEALSKARAAQKTPYDVKQWIDAVQKGDAKEAAHLWSHIQNQLPKNLIEEAKAAYLVQLAELEMHQTFVNQLLSYLANKKFVRSKAWKELEPKLTSHLGNLLVSHAIFIRPDQKHLIDKLPAQGIGGELKAWAHVRDKQHTAKILKSLPDGHKMREYFVPKAVLHLAQSGKVKDAIEILEDELASEKLSEEARSAYNLNLGRLHFQMAELDEAEASYLKVSQDSSSINDAREELLWVWLRKGDHSRLRGAVSSMPLGKYEDAFIPELFVTRAISNLKLCYFEDTKEDFGNFITYNKRWAEKIEKAVKETKTPRPESVDMYTALLEVAEAKRRQEADVAKSLHSESIAAAVPAVGRQKHWKAAEAELRKQAHQLEQDKIAQYRRIWRNNSVMLHEAIRKMKFVKVELLSQLQRDIKPNPESEAAKRSAEEAMTKVEKEGKGRWVFPFDGVTWPDEVFAARSTAGNICL